MARLRATCCAAATYFRIRSSTPGLFDGPPSLDAPKGFLLPIPLLTPTPYKSEYPVEARLGTLPNSYFTTGRSRLFSLYVLGRLYSIHEVIFYPISPFLYQTLARISRQREKERERGRDSRVSSAPSPPPVVCGRFYDVCHPRGPLLSFITMTVALCVATLTLGLMKYSRMISPVLFHANFCHTRYKKRAEKRKSLESQK